MEYLFCLLNIVHDLIWHFMFRRQRYNCMSILLASKIEFESIYCIVVPFNIPFNMLMG